MEEFSTALREGDEGAVLRLVDTDPTLLERMVDNRDRPLGLAAEHGHLGVVRLLIERGANVNATGYNGSTALHRAAYKGRVEVVEFLLAKGAHANTRDNNGVTPLMWASGNRHLGVVKMLVQHMEGQGLDERSNGGSTALHYAAGEGDEEAVRCLLLVGADPTITDDQGTAPDAHAGIYHFLATSEQHARCVAVFQWWQGELERRALLSRATCLHKAYTTQRDQPTSQVPNYLEARVAAGHALPVVEVVSPQSQEQPQQEQEEQEASGKRKAAGEGGEAPGAEAGEEEETRHAVLEYVVKGLHEALLTELLGGFHCGK